MHAGPFPLIGYRVASVRPFSEGHVCLIAGCTGTFSILKVVDLGQVFSGSSHNMSITYHPGFIFSTSHVLQAIMPI